MSALILLIFLSLGFSLSALWVFLWAQRSGQFDLLSGEGEGEGAELPLIDSDESTQLQSRQSATYRNQKRFMGQHRTKGGRLERRGL